MVTGHARILSRWAIGGIAWVHRPSTARFLLSRLVAAPIGSGHLAAAAKKGAA
jgi:hypothetical protein